MKNKIELYFISLGLLFFLFVLTTVNFPIYFGEDWTFVGIKNVLKLNIVPIVCIILIIIVCCLYSRFSYKLKGALDIPYKVEEIKNINYEYLTFLTTYIIPLICFDLSNIRDIIVLSVLLIILGCLFTKTNLYYANPSLALLGYHIYRAKLETRYGAKDDVILIAREKVKKGDTVLPKKLEENVYFIKVQHNE